MEKRHIGVYGILRRKNQILLILKTRGPYVGKFDLPGGGIHHGEGIEEALQRELNEEVGLPQRSSKVRFFSAATSITNDQENGETVSLHHIGLIYEVSGFREEDLCFSIQEEDVNGAAWIDFSVDERQLSPFAAYVIRKLECHHV